VISFIAVIHTDELSIITLSDAGSKSTIAIKKGDCSPSNTTTVTQSTDALTKNNVNDHWIAAQDNLNRATKAE
jgi:hypothetical protein